MLIIVLVGLYLSIIGVLTVLESKVLGAVQNSLSLFKFSFLGLYWFYWDFVKTLVKGLFNSGVEKSLPTLTMAMVFIITMMLFFILLLLGLNVEGFEMQTIMLATVLDIMNLIIKIVFLKSLMSKFISYTLFSVKVFYVFFEGVFSGLMFLSLVYLSFLECSCGDKGLSMFVFVFVFVWLLLYYILMLSKMFSTPFDFFEMESEMCGGGTSEFYGATLLMWSLFEYGVLFNNLLFLIFMLNIYLKLSVIFSTILLVVFLTSTSLISGLLTSFRVASSFNFILLIYLLVSNILMLVYMV